MQLPRIITYVVEERHVLCTYSSLAWGRNAGFKVEPLGFASVHETAGLRSQYVETNRWIIEGEL